MAAWTVCCPTGRVNFEEALPTDFPAASRTVVTTVVAASRVPSLVTVVATWAVPRCWARSVCRFGVVTYVPHRATCTGSVTVRWVLR